MSTRAYVKSLPECDFCSVKDVETDAQYDGRTVFGSWANMCIAHFGQYGTGLGTGRGQELVVKPVAMVETADGAFEQADASDAAFKSWMEEVDTGVIGEVGVSAYDLPDACYRDWFESGMGAPEAAGEVVSGAMAEMGFDW